MKEQEVKEILEKIGVEQFDDIVKQICQLFEPKGEKPPVLGVEILLQNTGRQYPDKSNVPLLTQRVRAIAQAQRDADLPYIEQARQEAMEEVGQAIEDYWSLSARGFRIKYGTKGESLGTELSEIRQVIQALKNSYKEE